MQDTPKKQYLQYTVTVTFEVPADQPAEASTAIADLDSAVTLRGGGSGTVEVKKVRTVKR